MGLWYYFLDFGWVRGLENLGFLWNSYGNPMEFLLYENHILKEEFLILSEKKSMSGDMFFDLEGEKIYLEGKNLDLEGEKSMKKWISAMIFLIFGRFFGPCFDFLVFGNEILGILGAKPLCSVVNCGNLKKYFLASKFPIFDGKNWILSEIFLILRGKNRCLGIFFRS